MRQAEQQAHTAAGAAIWPLTIRSKQPRHCQQHPAKTFRLCGRSRPCNNQAATTSQGTPGMWHQQDRERHGAATQSSCIACLCTAEVYALCVVAFQMCFAGICIPDVGVLHSHCGRVCIRGADACIGVPLSLPRTRLASPGVARALLACA